MDKTDLTYDVVCRLEEKMDKRLDCLEQKVDNLELFKTRILTICASITFAGSVIYNLVKDWLHI